MSDHAPLYPLSYYIAKLAETGAIVNRMVPKDDCAFFVLFAMPLNSINSQAQPSQSLAFIRQARLCDPDRCISMIGWPAGQALAGLGQ